MADSNAPAGDGVDSGSMLLRPTPLASGGISLTIAILVGVAYLFHDTPLPDAPRGDVRTQLAAIVAGPTATPGGVHVTLPAGWTFAQYAHSPQLLRPLTVPGVGQVRVGPARRVVFAAKRTPGFCVAMLEQGRIEHMDLEDDAAALKQTIDQSVYERNVFQWFTSTRGNRFAHLVNTADEMLNQPGPATRVIGFTSGGESSLQLGTVPARQLTFTANVNGRESAVLSYIVAHQGAWQYALIGVVADPPRLCGLEIGWLLGQLSFE